MWPLFWSVQDPEYPPFRPLGPPGLQSASVTGSGQWRASEDSRKQWAGLRRQLAWEPAFEGLRVPWLRRKLSQEPREAVGRRRAVIGLPQHVPFGTHGSFSHSRMSHQLAQTSGSDLCAALPRELLKGWGRGGGGSATCGGQRSLQPDRRGRPALKAQYCGAGV